MARATKRGLLGGRTVGGRYKLEELVEPGNAGEVYAATDISGARDVAIVAFSRGPLAEKARLDELALGVRKLGVVRHLSLGRFISQHLLSTARQKGDNPYLVFAHQDGESLGNHMTRTGALDPSQASFILRQVISALEVLHAAGHCHGGLSPERVRVRPDHLLHDDYVRVHLPVVSGALLSAAVAILDAGEIVAPVEAERLLYAAPEALLDEPPSLAGDIYSAGALLYLCLTGKAPMPVGANTEDPAALRDTLLFSGPPPMTETRSDLPRDLLQLVTRCMSKDTEERPSCIEELQSVLSDHAPEPAFTGCREDEVEAALPVSGKATDAPPILHLPTPVAFSLGDAQREAALRRQPVLEVPPAPISNLQLDRFNTISIDAPPEIMATDENDRPEDLVEQNAVEDKFVEDADEQDTCSTAFQTIAMPSPFTDAKVSNTPVEINLAPSEKTQPDLQPTGERTVDFSTVLLPTEEFAQEATEPDQPEDSPDDASSNQSVNLEVNFRMVELSLEELEEMKLDDEDV